MKQIKHFKPVSQPSHVHFTPVSKPFHSFLTIILLQSHNHYTPVSAISLPFQPPPRNHLTSISTGCKLHCFTNIFIFSKFRPFFRLFLFLSILAFLLIGRSPRPYFSYLRGPSILPACLPFRFRLVVVLFKLFQVQSIEELFPIHRFDLRNGKVRQSSVTQSTRGISSSHMSISKSSFKIFFYILLILRNFLYTQQTCLLLGALTSIFL